MSRLMSGQQIQVRLVRLFIAFALLAIAAVSEARTFKVLDTATDQPIAGVSAHVVIYGTLPGIGHPTEITLGEWNLKSDEKGEFSIWSLWSDDAVVELTMDGFVRIQTVKAYRTTKSSPEEKINTFYMTRKADEVTETIKFLVEKCRDELEQNEDLIRKFPRAAGQLKSGLVSIAVSYGESKQKVRTEQERLVLLGFCQFTSVMRKQRDAGWPNMGTLESLRRNAEELIRDCESPKSTNAVPGTK